MLSWIAQNALMVLVHKQEASIKDMKPKDMESNLFSYHLQSLITNGYVTKISRGTYNLTSKGHTLAGSFSTVTNSQQENIKTVIMLYAKNHDGQYLFFQWNRQPYINMVTLLHDRMPSGKSLDQGIRDASLDKLGVELPMVYMTTALVKILHEGVLVSHMNALVYKVDIATIHLPYQSRNGTAFLALLKDVDNKMEGMGELIEGLDTQTHPKEFHLMY